ncbi:MAG: hypothetical protein QOE09_2725 [Ilumatobacteraceae bacterium]
MSPPPGYVAYGGPGAQAGSFQPVGRISRAMVILLWIYLPLQVLTIFDQVRLRREAKKFLDGVISEQKFRDTVQVNPSSIVGLVIIPIAVLTMIWMYRMAANVRKLDRPGQTWAPGWAIAGWFVPPCVVYAIPWLMFRELWRASDPAIPPGDPSWKKGPVPALITVWWVLYGLVPLLGFFSAAGVAGQIRAGMTMRALAERFRDFGTVNIFFTVVGMVTTVVYLRWVQMLSARHMQATREA